MKLDIFIYIYIYTYICVCVCVCMSVSVCVCVCLCVCVCKAFLTLIHWLVTAPVETFHSLEGAVLPSMTFPQSPASTDASHVAPKAVAPILAITGMVLTEVEVQPQNQLLSKLNPLIV